MERDNVIDRLLKLKLRLAGKTLGGPLLNELEKLSPAHRDYILAGLFLHNHMDIILEALKRAD